MARMKIEVAAARAAERGVASRERLVAYLPRYALLAARVPWLMNLRDRVPGLAAVSERFLGLSKDRTLPRWRGDRFQPKEEAQTMEGAEAVLFADTFNRYFEPENLHAAQAVLHRAGIRVAHAQPASGRRPLCCGRTFLAAGLVEEAKAEMRRTIEALAPALRKLIDDATSLVTPGEFDPQSSDATMTVCVNDYMQSALVVPLISTLRRSAPNMKLGVRNLEIAGLTSMLARGSIDMAITIPEFVDPGLRTRFL